METKNKIEKNTIKVADNISDLVLSSDEDRNKFASEIERIVETLEDLIKDLREK